MIMEQILDQLWTGIVNYINLPYLLTFMLFAYLVKRYFKQAIDTIFKRDVKLVFIVLIIATLLAIPYYFFVKNDWVRLLFTYTLGTSLHELIFTWIENKFKK